MVHPVTLVQLYEFLSRKPQYSYFQARCQCSFYFRSSDLFRILYRDVCRSSIVALRSCFRASKIISQPVWIAGIVGRIISLSLRLDKLRWIALPIERPAATPILKVFESLGCLINTISGWAYDFPKRLTRIKSADFFSRYFRFIPVLSISLWYVSWNWYQYIIYDSLTFPVDFLDVVVHFYWKGMSSFYPSPFQYVSTTGGFHPFPKAMYSNPSSSFWLVCSFWHYFLPIINPIKDWFLNLFKSTLDYTLGFIYGQTIKRL